MGNGGWYHQRDDSKRVSVRKYRGQDCCRTLRGDMTVNYKYYALSGFCDKSAKVD